MDWKPVVTTDSAELAWMNGADLTAVVEDGDGGPTIRVYRSGVPCVQDFSNSYF